MAQNRDGAGKTICNMTVKADFKVQPKKKNEKKRVDESGRNT